MAKDTTTVTLRDIEKIVQQIVEHFQPQKVILFGSEVMTTGIVLYEA